MCHRSLTQKHGILDPTNVSVVGDRHRPLCEEKGGVTSSLKYRHCAELARVGIAGTPGGAIGVPSRTSAFVRCVVGILSSQRIAHISHKQECYAA